MKILTSTAALLAGFAGVASAWSGAAAAQSPAYEVVRLGDGQMGCEDLAAQINALTAEADAARASAVADAAAAQRRTQAAAARSGAAKRAAWGGLATGMAYMPFGGGLASFALRGAAMNAASAAANGPQVIQVNTGSAPVADPPQARRLAHLSGIFQRKSC